MFVRLPPPDRVDTRLLLAWIHLLALGVGLPGVWARARALRAILRDPDDAGALRRAFAADAWWGIAGATWLVTGVWRLVAVTEKDVAWYFSNHAFLLKLALFVAILLLEAWPMTTMMSWRTRRASPTPRNAGRIEAISYVQCALVLAIVLAAAGAARGYGAPGTRGAGGTGDPALRTPSGDASRATPRLPGASPTRASPARGDTGALADPTPVEPTGTEVVTPDDLALLAREIAMPLEGVDPATLVSGFDQRRGGGSRAHQALDVMRPRGTPVLSAAKGRVLKLFTSAAGGLMVYAADSSERFILMYAHLDAYAPGLRDGAALARGQVIGTVGSTGNASPTAPHLHFAIARSADVRQWSRGVPVDPVPVLQASRNTVR